MLVLNWVPATNEMKSESVSGGVGTRDREGPCASQTHKRGAYRHRDILPSLGTNVMINAAKPMSGLSGRRYLGE